MRTRRLLALGGAIGAMAGAAASSGIAAGWSAALAGLWAGSALGLGVAGLWLAATARPLTVAAALAALIPLASILGARLGLAETGNVAALLTLPLLAALVGDASARAEAHLNMLTAAVATYGGFLLLGALHGPPSALLATLSGALAPLAFYCVGMLLTAQTSARADSARRRLDARAPAVRTLSCAAGAGTLAAALLATLPLPLPDAIPEAPLAGLFGVLLVLGLSWDTTHTFRRALLGAAPRLARVALLGGAVLALLLTLATLARASSQLLLLALAGTLLAVFTLRRRRTELALLGLLALPLLLLLPHPPDSSYSTLTLLLDGRIWGDALAGAGAGPLGQGIGWSAPLSADTQFSLALRELGIPGFAALLWLLAIALYTCWRGWWQRRRTSADAGVALAAGGITLYVVLAGLGADPLRDPVLALFFWLYLGLANSTLAPQATAPQASTTLASARSAAADFVAGGRPGAISTASPLRVAYLVDGAESGETPVAIYDLLQAMDRRRITPLVISYAPGPFALAASQRRLPVRVVDRHDATRSSCIPWVTTLPPRARRLARTALVWRLLPLVDGALHHLRTAREVLALARALLDLDAELLVSTAPRLHVPALLAGRIAGIPVQWHARDAAPAARQPLLNILARWTSGVLTPTQAAARRYDLRHLGARVRVLRPSVTLAPPATSEQAAALRQTLAPGGAGPILTVLAPVSAESGHQDLLDAALFLLGGYPGLRIFFAREALPATPPGSVAPPSDALLSPDALAGVYTAADPDSLVAAASADDDISPLPSHAAQSEPPPSERELRLARAITTSGLDGIVTDLGPRADMAELLAASDLAVFPFRQVSASRGLLHALAAGVPLVATDLPALREQLADAWGYTLTEPGDPAALARALARALGTLDEFRAAARRNPWLVRDWFDASVELSRLLPLYRSICRPAPPRMRLPHPRLPLLPRTVGTPHRWIAALWAEGE